MLPGNNTWPLMGKHCGKLALSTICGQEWFIARPCEMLSLIAWWSWIGSPRFLWDMFFTGVRFISAVLEKRAAIISVSVKDALDRSIPINLHQDSSLIKPKLLHSVWCANRLMLEKKRESNRRRSENFCFWGYEGSSDRRNLCLLWRKP